MKSELHLGIFYAASLYCRCQRVAKSERNCMYLYDCTTFIVPAFALVYRGSQVCTCEFSCIYFEIEAPAERGAKNHRVIKGGA